ncbi:ParB/RepB/Spo0J family partition protein [Gordonia rubripertincta]|uniref:ParB/RepB/Spo0J family partition protein n=1 Tax=Gordonia rubripertincta TaxID=36822 RepID=UPI0015F80C7E|nr:ParB/RepB/Spo0J family partition protein [Gordonia rubripertincta]QMU22527.1 ParB/RepB/Spo0J family partition protein [Gordonia rubripertincta]
MSTAPVIEQVELKPSQLVPHAKNIRADVGDVSDLADSVRAKGVLQPLVVVPNGEPDRYVIIAGHRRHAAAKAAQVETVPCVIRHDLTDEADQIAVMMVENGQRTDLTAVEEAKGVQTLLDLGDTQKRIAARTGMSPAKVRLRAKVAKLPAEVTAKLTEHAVTLDDAAFLADHADNPDRLAELEEALGTNNWAFAKQRVITRIEKEKAEAKLRRQADATGLTVIDTTNNYSAARARRDEIAADLGVKPLALMESTTPWRTEFDPDADALATAKEDPALSFVHVESRWAGNGHALHARLVIYRAPSPETIGPDPVTADPHAEAAGDETGDGAESDRAPAVSAEVAAAAERREALAAATAVRHKFITGVISRGDMAHARLAGQYAARAGDFVEISFEELLPYLPIDDPAADADPWQRGVREERSAAVVAWFDTTQNPHSLLLGYAWLWLDLADRVLQNGDDPDYLEAEECAAVCRYADVLVACGYTMSDIELEVIEAIKQATSDESGDEE